MTKAKRTIRSDVPQLIIIIILTVLTVAFLLPILITLSISLSTTNGLAHSTLGLWPKEFTLNSYNILLNSNDIIRYYRNTVFYAVANTAVMLTLTSMLSYVLIQDGLPGKKLITMMLVITMFFSGGLVPSFINIKSLGLYDSVWVMIIPGTVSAWNVIIFRTFFKELPVSLRESAFIDGAGHIRILISIILPLSMPLIATMMLFNMVGVWNDYLSPLIYMKRAEIKPIALLLRKMVVLMDTGDAQQGIRSIGSRNSNGRTIKCAAVIVTMLPIMTVYPFLQKYFTKGIMIGSIKE